MHTVIAAFDDRQDAQRALERLVESGFSRDMVHQQTRDDAWSDGTDRPRAADESHGFFEGIRRFFADLFGADEAEGDAGRYAEAIRRGSTVVIIDAADESEADRARGLLSSMDGLVDVDERASQWSREGWAGFDARAASDLPRSTAAGSDAATRTEGEQVMPVVQEELQVGKRAVSTGGVRVIQRVTETPDKEMVRLRDERATIERRPVDRPAGEADFANFKEGTIEVRETTEEPVVAKTARVVEEVVVGKEVQERTETVADTVRRTDVEVERLGADTTRRGADTTTATGGVTGGSLREQTESLSDRDAMTDRGSMADRGATAERGSISEGESTAERESVADRRS
jgi:uncharacterized protein (TIGR02271 family)